MNGYKMTADSYRTLRGNSKLDQADVESNIKVLDFLATCTQEDIYNLFNSTAFNFICLGYVKMALNGFKELDDDTKDRIINRVWAMFDEKNAKQAGKYSND
nr:MAG TPA: hypothetical protein [Caudoviricetes sp.]